MFILFMNDLSLSLESNHLFFADDLKLFAEVSGEDDSLILQGYQVNRVVKKLQRLCCKFSDNHYILVALFCTISLNDISRIKIQTVLKSLYFFGRSNLKYCILIWYPHY